MKYIYIYIYKNIDFDILIDNFTTIKIEKIL